MLCYAGAKAPASRQKLLPAMNFFRTLSNSGHKLSNIIILLENYGNWLQRMSLKVYLLSAVHKSNAANVPMDSSSVNAGPNCTILLVSFKQYSPSTRTSEYS